MALVRRYRYTQSPPPAAVERPIRHIAESFHHGRVFVNDADVNNEAERRLTDVANVCQHGTTGERSVDRFERDERTAPEPLAGQPHRRVEPGTPSDKASPQRHRRTCRGSTRSGCSLSTYAELVR